VSYSTRDALDGTSEEENFTIKMNGGILVYFISSKGYKFKATCKH